MIRVTAAGSQSADELLAHFLNFPLIAEIEDRKKDAVTARLIQGARVCLSVLLLPEKYWSLLHRETSSLAHLKEA